MNKNEANVEQTQVQDIFSQMELVMVQQKNYLSFNHINK
jgi:hypothetical protein